MKKMKKSPFMVSYLFSVGLGMLSITPLGAMNSNNNNQNVTKENSSQKSPEQQLAEERNEFLEKTCQFNFRKFNQLTDEDVEQYFKALIPVKTITEQWTAKNFEGSSYYSLKTFAESGGSPASEGIFIKHPHSLSESPDVTIKSVFNDYCLEQDPCSILGCTTQDKDNTFLQGPFVQNPAVAAILKMAGFKAYRGDGSPYQNSIIVIPYSSAGPLQGSSSFIHKNIPLTLNSSNNLQNINVTIPWVAVNTAGSSALFTLAHELGHILAHHAHRRTALDTIAHKYLVIPDSKPIVTERTLKSIVRQHELEADAIACWLLWKCDKLKIVKDYINVLGKYCEDNERGTTDEEIEIKNYWRGRTHPAFARTSNLRDLHKFYKKEAYAGRIEKNASDPVPSPRRSLYSIIRTIRCKIAEGDLGIAKGLLRALKVKYTQELSFKVAGHIDWKQIEADIDAVEAEVKRGSLGKGDA